MDAPVDPDVKAIATMRAAGNCQCNGIVSLRNVAECVMKRAMDSSSSV